MEYNLVEKLAILKAIDEVILADGEVSSAEIDLLSQIARLLKFDQTTLLEARKTGKKESWAVLKEMPKNKKHALAVLLKEMGSADGDFSKKEHKLIKKILKKADFKFNRMFQ